MIMLFNSQNITNHDDAVQKSNSTKYDVVVLKSKQNKT